MRAPSLARTVIAIVDLEPRVCPDKGVVRNPLSAPDPARPYQAWFKRELGWFAQPEDAAREYTVSRHAFEASQRRPERGTATARDERRHPDGEAEAEAEEVEVEVVTEDEAPVGPEGAAKVGKSVVQGTMANEGVRVKIDSDAMVEEPDHSALDTTARQATSGQITSVQAAIRQAAAEPSPVGRAASGQAAAGQAGEPTSNGSHSRSGVQSQIAASATSAASSSDAASSTGARVADARAEAAGSITTAGTVAAVGAVTTAGAVATVGSSVHARMKRLKEVLGLPPPTGMIAALAQARSWAFGAGGATSDAPVMQQLDELETLLFG